MSITKENVELYYIVVNERIYEVYDDKIEINKKYPIEKTKKYKKLKEYIGELAIPGVIINIILTYNWKIRKISYELEYLVMRYTDSALTTKDDITIKIKAKHKFSIFANINNIGGANMEKNEDIVIIKETTGKTEDVTLNYEYFKTYFKKYFKEKLRDTYKIKFGCESKEIVDENKLSKKAREYMKKRNITLKDYDIIRQNDINSIIEHNIICVRKTKKVREMMYLLYYLMKRHRIIGEKNDMSTDDDLDWDWVKKRQRCKKDKEKMTNEKVKTLSEELKKLEELAAMKTKITELEKEKMNFEKAIKKAQNHKNKKI